MQCRVLGNFDYIECEAGLQENNNRRNVYFSIEMIKL